MHTKQTLDVLDISSKKIKQLNDKGIYTIEDLINFKPRKYIMLGDAKSICELKDSEYATVIVRIDRIIRKNNILILKCFDDKYDKINITFFNQSYLCNFSVGDKYVFSGKISISEKYGKGMINPIQSTIDTKDYIRIYPIYSKIKNLSSNYLMNTLSLAIENIDKDEYLDYSLLKKYNLITRAEKIRKMHMPQNEEDIKSVERRNTFDELFTYNMKLYNNSNKKVKSSKFLIKTMDKTKKFINDLDFELTNGQKDALKEMIYKIKKGNKLNVLLQADVGAGKTIVAIIMMILMCENGYQAGLMCPTNVLAKQHYEEIKERLKNTGLNVSFLSSEVKKREKNSILKKLKEGEIDILIGTHSIISKDIKFKNLAITIIDEEHRFGVQQRKLLSLKSDEGVHNISMSATPIPRSLALTIYSDNIDVINIKTMPKGRKPVKTMNVKNDEEAFIKIEEELKKGRQCYIVCPFIEDNEILNVENIDDTYKKVKKYFKDRYGIGVIHSNLKKEDISKEINKFKNNEYQIIISTTIIEVGVNIPNSTIILIKSAERFGLAQLHQLRGRVGRNSYQSYCLLQLNNTKSEFATKKINIMCNSNDAFKIAEEDLKLRGAGNLIGEEQSGYSKFMDLIISNQELNTNIREDIKNIFSNKGSLYHYKFLI